jgi:hypothetical protein
MGWSLGIAVAGAPGAVLGPRVLRCLDPAAAERGRALFNAKANCASCHSGPAFTDADLRLEAAADLLGIDQAKVSRITRGQFRGISEAKLLELVAKLGHDVKIVVGPVRRRAGKIELQFA